MERILLTSPVRIIWLAAEICGLRLRAKIMKAFMGRLGVPSALRVWDVSAWYGSSGGRGSRRGGAGGGGAGGGDMIVSDGCEWGGDAGTRGVGGEKGKKRGRVPGAGASS